jgi:hypothetical protein
MSTVCDHASSIVTIVTVCCAGMYTVGICIDEIKHLRLMDFFLRITPSFDIMPSFDCLPHHHQDYVLLTTIPS